MKSNTSALFAPFLIFLFAVFSGFIIYRAAWFGIDKHFSLLADSFLKGDLFLSPMNLPDGDYADYFGKQYLFFGPLPSIILMPAVMIFGKNFPQMTLSIASLVVTFGAIFLLISRFKFNLSDTFWLTNFFVFGTVLYFVGLINVSAYVVQAVGVAFIVLSLFEYFSLRRWFVIGLIVAAAGATRISLFAMAIFYLLEIWRLRNQIDARRSLLLLMVPILFSLLVLGIYNLRRFGSVFDTGYSRNVSVLNKGYPNLLEGVTSIKHIPANLYLLLAAPPDPVKKDKLQFVMEFPYLRANGQGMAIWFTSPLFIYLLFARRQPYTISAISGIVALAIPSLLYFGLGISQFGYRYSLDFIPLLFLILLSAFQKGLPTFAKVLITVGIFFNLFYMSSLWNSYPLLNFWEYLD
ncbi:MAG: hypothetical protein AAB639_00300 [Patescibacteria group bacterium]